MKNCYAWLYRPNAKLLGLANTCKKVNDVNANPSVYMISSETRQLEIENTECKPEDDDSIDFGNDGVSVNKNSFIFA